MGRITAIEPQKRNPDRVNISIDGEFRLGLYRITAAWLQVGQDISDERLAQLAGDDQREAARAQALRLLERRERTSAEIARNLRQHEFPQEVIDDVIHRLSQSGLINDARFAARWVENRAEFRPRGRRALTQELRQRGLPDEVISDVTARIDEETLAYQAGVKHSRKLAGLEWADFRQKLGSFLARRGFGYDVAASVVRRIWQEQHIET